MGANEPVVGVKGSIRVAAVDTAFPAGPDDPYPAGWHDLGLVSVDGLTNTGSTEKEEFGAWQLFGPARVSITRRGLHLAFELLEWSEATVMFAYGGGTVDTVSGGFEYTPPLEGEVDFRALSAEVIDGDLTYRWNIRKGLAAEDVESVFQKASLGMLPIGFDVLWPSDGSVPWSLQTNDSAFIADFLSS